MSDQENHPGTTPDVPVALDHDRAATALVYSTVKLLKLLDKAGRIEARPDRLRRMCPDAIKTRPSLSSAINDLGGVLGTGCAPLIISPIAHPLPQGGRLRHKGDCSPPTTGAIYAL